ncbi:hypothetical protein B0H13DRAFT_1897851 [Mycena leptocephala]|nr:hypothetical protein B0H13DRAFT_1897851 [Mycena leptocephala]
MPQWPLEGPLVCPRTVDAATFRFTHSRTAKSVADAQWVMQQFGGTWPSFNANATKALVSEPAQHLNEKRRRHISSSSNTLAMQLRSPQTRDEIALHQEWDDGAASTVVASEVMHSPSARRNVNAFGHPEGQDSKSSFGTTSLAIEDLSEYIPVFNDSSFAFGFSSDLHLHFQEEDYTPRASVGPQNYHAHSSIKNHETMLASSDSRHGNLHSTGRSYGVFRGRVVSQPLTTPTVAFPEVGAPPTVSALPPATVVRDFVSMNDTFISTDLPEDSPFTVIPADGQRKSFPGYPYPEGRRWTQTFKSRRWHASFVGRARSHVHRGQWMRRTISLAGFRTGPPAGTRRQPVPGPANTVPDRPAGFKPVRVTRGYVRTRGTLRVGGSIANHRNNGKNVIRALFRGDYITTLAQMKYGPDVSGFGATRHGVLSVSNHRKNVGRVSE